MAWSCWSPTTGARARQFLNVITNALQSNPILRTATSPRSSTSALQASTATRPSLTPRAGRPDPIAAPRVAKALGQYPTALREARDRLDSFSGLLVNNSDTTISPLRQLLLVSGDDRLDPSERDAYLAQVTQTVERGTKGVNNHRHATIHHLRRKTTCSRSSSRTTSPIQAERRDRIPQRSAARFSQRAYDRPDRFGAGPESPRGCAFAAGHRARSPSTSWCAHRIRRASSRSRPPATRSARSRCPA